MKPRIFLLVVDLDNTLYDWVTFFTSAFYEMVAVAGPMLGVSEEQLLDELHVVHQRYRNSEQPFALLETESAVRTSDGADRAAKARALGPAFAAFNRARDATLRVYPDVKETLTRLKQSSRIVGHTEASAANAVYRLQKLGLDELVEPLYAAAELGPPHPFQERADHYAGALARVRMLGPSQRKPDARVLLDICANQAVAPEHTLYVGDSISRDIGMAKAAGTWAAWAKYGTKYDAWRWEKLVRITHWTPEDVARARRSQELFGDVRPDVTLETSFAEILNHFDFAG
jgi:FMN phosphatase YigB (HAD superfamily)